ncbi:MAG TPA: hypothetical protein PKC13_19060 [Blastocatellia bacterium]|nr:hypothetical protein [Blastocatellia bacterium]
MNTDDFLGLIHVDLCSSVFISGLGSYALENRYKKKAFGKKAKGQDLRPDLSPLEVRDLRRNV